MRHLKRRTRKGAHRSPQGTGTSQRRTRTEETRKILIGPHLRQRETRTLKYTSSGKTVISRKKEEGGANPLSSQRLKGRTPEDPILLGATTPIPHLRRRRDGSEAWNSWTKYAREHGLNMGSEREGESPRTSELHIAASSPISAFTTTRQFAEDGR